VRTIVKTEWVKKISAKVNIKANQQGMFFYQLGIQGQTGGLMTYE
jgi:hypothetical protein